MIRFIFSDSHTTSENDFKLLLFKGVKLISNSFFSTHKKEEPISHETSSFLECRTGIWRRFILRDFVFHSFSFVRKKKWRISSNFWNSTEKYMDPLNLLRAETLEISGFKKRKVLFETLFFFIFQNGTWKEKPEFVDLQSLARNSSSSWLEFLQQQKKKKIVLNFYFGYFGKRVFVKVWKQEINSFQKRRDQNQFQWK